MSDDGRPSDADVYLHVMPRYANGQRWHVFQVSDESPRITLAGSVASYDELRRLATRAKWPVRFAEQAWRQMVAAGVAPDMVPDDVTIV